MTATLKPYSPQDNGEFHDHDRDPELKRPGLDVSSLAWDAARTISRDCPHCDGNGLATVFDPIYDGNSVIEYAAPDGQYRSRPGRVASYCLCALGRKIMTNHRLEAPDVYARTPDFEEIKGKPSYWLEYDPSMPADQPNLPALTTGQMFRRILHATRST